jgi:ribonucleoside-diphosphate reductase beta chain
MFTTYSWRNYMSIFTPRIAYGPFEYPEYYEMCCKQQAAHWLPTEFAMASDIQDWKINLSETEKFLIGSVLKGFTQSEIFIGNDYWSSKVVRWFKKPEIQMMATTFAATEVAHAQSYSYLEESLGIQDYQSFMTEPTAKAKIERLMSTGGKSKEDIVRSIAIFSAFNEGVNLFSSFAILLNFSRFNKLKAVGQIISFSIADEAMHSTAGCMLFKQVIKEFPELFTDELKKDIYDAARLTIELEDAFLEKAFSLGAVEGLTLSQMRTFIRHRANLKLQELGLKPNWRSLNKQEIDSMLWFDIMSNGNLNHQDFFAGRVSTYSKGLQHWESIWD